MRVPDQDSAKKSPSLTLLETIRQSQLRRAQLDAKEDLERPNAELDGETLEQLREIDDLNKGAQSSLQEFKGKS